MNRIQELSRQIAHRELEVPLDPPLPRWPRPKRQARRGAGGERPAAQAAAKPSRNSATLSPSDSTA
jgi:hypothetical protein